MNLLIMKVQDILEWVAKVFPKSGRPLNIGKKARQRRVHHSCWEHRDCPLRHRSSVKACGPNDFGGGVEIFNFERRPFEIDQPIKACNSIPARARRARRAFAPASGSVCNHRPLKRSGMNDQRAAALRDRS